MNKNLKQKCESNYLALPKELFFTNSLEGLRESGLYLKGMDACVNLLRKKQSKSLRWLGMVPSAYSGLMCSRKKEQRCSLRNIVSGPWNWTGLPPRDAWERDNSEKC